MARRWFPVLFAALVPLVAGCSNEKKDALLGLEKIKAACEDNDKAIANKLAEDLRAQNKIFSKAFSAATDDAPGSVNICSPLLHNRISTMIQHGS